MWLSTQSSSIKWMSLTQTQSSLIKCMSLPQMYHILF
jgi:hypothetical protein